MANWSIVYVPFNGDGTVITGGVITMKPAAFYSLIHNEAMGNIAGRVAGTTDVAGESAYDITPGNWVGRGFNAAAINTARDTQAAAAVATETAAANTYFETVFNNIGGVPGNVNDYFANVILPNIGADATANPGGGLTSGAINTANSFAYLLLIKYDAAIANNNHTNVYYKKYMGNNAASQAGALYNAFNVVHPNAPIRTGGYRKQSKKHRRKYSKGRTARR